MSHRQSIHPKTIENLLKRIEANKNPNRAKCAELNNILYGNSEVLIEGFSFLPESLH